MLLCSSVFSASLFLYLHMIQHYHCFICLFRLPHIYQFLFTVPCLLLIPSLQFQFPSSWSISSSSYFSKSLSLVNFLRFIFSENVLILLSKKKSRSSSHQYCLGVLILLVATGDSPSWRLISLQVQYFYCLFLSTCSADMVFFCGLLCAVYYKKYFCFHRGSRSFNDSAPKFVLIFQSVIPITCSEVNVDPS